MQYNEIKWRLKTIVSNNRFGFKYITLPLAKRSWLIVNRSTDIVIEGFPRSGNTFCCALLYYLKPDIKIARHRHELGHLAYASELEKPIVCVVREPIDSIVSLHIREGLSIDFCIQYYLDFHQYLLSKNDEIQIIDFDVLVNHTTATIKYINRTTCLALPEIEVDDEVSREIKNIVVEMENHEREFMGGNSAQVRTTHLAVPSKEREALKKEVMYDLELEQYEQTINEAKNLYLALVKNCNVESILCERSI